VVGARDRPYLDSMRPTAPARLALLTCALLGAACTAADVAEPDGRIVGANARFSFALVAPEPLHEGRIDLAVIVEDADDGTPIDGADVTVRLTMPAMGHTSDPLATETSAGRYAVADALVDMPGAWILRVRVNDGGLVDEAELPIQVP
jgi:hypothetical protein